MIGWRWGHWRSAGPPPSRMEPSHSRGWWLDSVLILLISGWAPVRIRFETWNAREIASHPPTTLLSKHTSFIALHWSLMHSADSFTLLYFMLTRSPCKVD